jgi:DNA end-binding protein Ku
MSRALWTGKIGFGLINIPVKLYSYVKGRRSRFRMLHKEDASPIRLEYVCQHDGRTVPRADLGKGVEDGPGHFVLLGKADFEAAAMEKQSALALVDFVARDAIAPRFFEKPYYLVPNKGGEHPYALLREALRLSDRVGIARLVFRGSQHTVALSASEEAILLNTLRFAEDFVDLSQVKFPSRDQVTEDELALSRDLLDRKAAPFAPEKYHDEYAQNLLRLIQARKEGPKPAPHAPPAPPRKGRGPSLVEQLRKSLAEAPPAPGQDRHAGS